MTDTSRSSANRATATARKVFIKTFGCQMNVYDSERMSDILTPHGYQTVAAAGEADLIILNTCHIREKAAEKVYSEIGRLRRFKQERPGETLIAVAGCVAQAEGEEIIRRAGAVDLVFGPQAYHRLPELLEQARTGERVVDTSFPVEDKFAAIPAAQRKTIAARGKAAFLTIQEGCDKFCTFCVVPYTRGAEISRPVRTVVEEAKRLADAGVCEITLLGQNVNAYHGDAATGAPVNLAGLIDTLAQVGGIKRLRYTTSHPRDMDEDLIAAHRDQPKLMPYVHLPIQSGSDRILAAMNRKHTASDYLEAVEKLRAARPDIAMSGDFIVGFPGESDTDFQATLDVVRQVGYAQAYSFKYSPRPGTPASSLGEQLPEQVKAERLAELQQLLNDQQSRFNAGCVGRTMAVLLDRPGRKQGQLAGRSPYLQAVQVDGPEMLAGTIRQVTISRAGSHSLFGTLGRESNGAAAQARPQPAEVGF